MSSLGFPHTFDQEVITTSDAVLTRVGEARAKRANDPALRRTILVALLASAGYFFTAKIGFAFALQPGPVSTLWMPNSILLAALLLVPKRSWWMVLLAAFPAHLASEVQSGVPIVISLLLFLSNSVQALIGAVGISYFVSDQLRFDRFHDLAVFVFFRGFPGAVGDVVPGRWRVEVCIVLGDLAHPVLFKRPRGPHSDSGDRDLGRRGY